MTQPAVFRATYSEWKLVKTRGVVQVIFEVPLAEHDTAYQALGGMPDPAKERWFGIARLRTDAVTPAPDSIAGPAPVDSEQAPPARAPRPFASLPLPQQAALLCQDPVFWAFVNDDLELDCKNEDDATKMLRTWCAVDSRSEIKPQTGHGQYFVELRERFLAWKQVAA